MREIFWFVFILLIVVAVSGGTYMDAPHGNGKSSHTHLQLHGHTGI